VRGRLNVQQIIKKPWNVKLQCEYQEDRYRCSPLLRKMAAEGKKFY
jgi:hypothetical protein